LGICASIKGGNAPQRIQFPHHAQAPARPRQVGKGVGRGVLLHGMLGLDAKNGSCLGLIGGRIWTRRGLIKIAHQKRLSTNKESHRWLATAERAKTVLAEAAMITVVADRESDIFAEWARLPAPNFHLITRSMQDRRLVNGETLYAAAKRFAFTATRFAHRVRAISLAA
jgi:hypothetical protein